MTCYNTIILCCYVVLFVKKPRDREEERERERERGGGPGDEVTLGE